jgi:hypothetical protein
MPRVANPEVPLPPGFSHLDPEQYKAIKYGHTINLRGPGLSTKIMDEIRAKQKNNESVVIVVTGPPGKGKTYLGLRWAQKLDPKFHITDIPPPPPNKDHGQATFDRKHIQYLVGGTSPLNRTQVIVMDEFHFGGGSRDWQNPDQKKLVKLIAAMRSKGFVVIIIVLHSKMVDRIVRDFVLNYEFAVKARGKAIAYRRWFPDKGNEPWRKRLGPMEMQLPDQGLCNYDDCFKCKHLDLENKNPDTHCETLRAIYERRKEWFLNQQSKEEDKKEPLPVPPIPELAKMMIPHIPIIPTWADKINRSRLKETVRKTLEVNIPERRVSDLASEIETLIEWRQRHPL